ncbi:alpha/beta fold hydrolase [Microcoleus sp. FACHB-672]|uniref:alpha/beta fold hydrolase n=1 Tax=Microcoleus sp. FACHB-672 TaxID=2692825 RepID=UPI0016864699|nr:alpha/beta hydrolase [Microcoleus sp. FACHB-672]MBD2039372.1 alpha/beta hydrolase [Microcoleus sp. FACHB-672]
MSLIGHVYSSGFKLQYIIEGNGVPTIVVGSSLYYSRTFSNNLRNSLKLVFVDHRGFSPPYDCKDTAQFQLDALVDDIELVRKELGFDKIIVIGHSGHAFMALEYAKKYPANVSHVVMMCAGPNLSQESHLATQRYLNDSVCPERKAALAENLARLPQEIEAAPEKAFITYCLLMGPKSWFDYNFDATKLWEGVEVNMAMFDYVWGEVFRDIDIAKNLDKLQAPVFLALGRYDYLQPPAYLWESVRDKFSNLTIRIFEKSSHAPQFEEPALFDKELVEWLFNVSIIMQSDIQALSNAE